jgi:hypothetical protein
MATKISNIRKAVCNKKIFGQLKILAGFFFGGGANENFGGKLFSGK